MLKSVVIATIHLMAKQAKRFPRASTLNRRYGRAVARLVVMKHRNLRVKPAGLLGIDDAILRTRHDPEHRCFSLA